MESKHLSRSSAVTKYGLFIVRCMNIGDDIQSIACLRFLPQVDYYIDRDNIRQIDNLKLKNNETLKMIMNGWFTAGYDYWPPKNKSFVPLLTSMHINPLYDKGAVLEKFAERDVVNYLNQFGPVGARDRSTFEYFKKNGIAAYYSACITLTINPETNVQKSNYILAVNVSDKVYEAIRQRTTREVIRMDVERTQDTSIKENLALAKYYLYMYQSAHCVITTRLHATLPTIATGGKVLFIIENNHDNHDFHHRFDGLYELAHYTSAEDFIEDHKMAIYDLEKPPDNPDTYKKLRDKLIHTLSSYTGFDSKQGYLQGQTIQQVLLGTDFFSAITKIAEGSWEGYKYRHNIEIPSTLNEVYHEAQLLKEDNECLRKRIDSEISPGIKIALKRLVKSVLYKVRLLHRPM